MKKKGAHKNVFSAAKIAWIHNITEKTKENNNIATVGACPVLLMKGNKE